MESGVCVQERCTCFMSFRTWDVPAINLRICTGVEPITSSILSEVPEEGGRSRIF